MAVLTTTQSIILDDAVNVPTCAILKRHGVHSNAVNTALCAFIPVCCYDEPNQTCLMDRRLSVSVDADTHRQLKVLAAQLDVSMNALVVDAVKAYLHNCCKNEYEKDTLE